MRYILLIGLMFLTSPLLADSPWIGKYIFIKYDVKARVDDKLVDSGGRFSTVTKVDGDWLWVDKEWVQKKDVLTEEQSLKYLTDNINQNPMARDWFYRGLIWLGKSEFDKALKDMTEAIELDATNPRPLQVRGLLWQITGEYDDSLRDLNEAIRLDPNGHLGYYYRGMTWKGLGKAKNALKDYDEAIRLNPKSDSSYRHRAELRLTSEDADVRNGEQALKDARISCDLSDWSSSDNIATLSSAYAETGDFESAIKWIKKAMELDTGKLHRSFHQEQLERYEAGKPYYDPLRK